MRKFLLRVISSFNAESKYDWFLLVAMMYLVALIVFGTIFITPAPPSPGPASPFG